MPRVCLAGVFILISAVPLPSSAEESQRAGTDWWSLRALQRPATPTVSDPAWVRSPVDAFILATLDDKRLPPSPPARRRSLIRRVTYDLTGLPPTPEEVEAFIDDPAPDAYDRLVDRLLASPHYGERWGRHWLDVVRFGESTGYERNTVLNNAWPFRDYIIRSFNEDKPYDRLILEHLAGDAIGRDDPNVEVGTTFLVAGPYDDVGNQDPVQAAQIRANTIDEIIRTVSETFLGLTVGCARCHDHKFDPIAQRDYYSLYATFAGVHHAARTVATTEAREQHARSRKPLDEKKAQLTAEKNKLEEAILARAETRVKEYEARWSRAPVARTGTEETFAPIEARYVRFIGEGLDTNPSARTGFRIDEFEAWTDGVTPHNVALAANGGRAEGASRTAEDFGGAYSAALAIDGRFGASWIASRPELVITFAKPSVINRVVFSSDRPGAAGGDGVATFVSDYRIEASLDRKTWQPIASSADRQPVNDAHRRKRLTDLTITDDERRQLAEYDRQLDEVNGGLAVLGSLPSWWVGRFDKADGPFHVFIGGSPQRKGDQVVPASLSALGDSSPGYQLTANESEQARRLALARWIVSPENPLPARVMANRLWHYHFGTGLVDTPSDFGAMGGRPTHPELLDWLAVELIARDWRLKPLHRLIVTSATYRQSAAGRDDAAAVDADSRYLSRFPPRRLAGEEIRDTTLAVAGRLDQRMGGPGFRLYRYLQDNVATYVPLDTHGVDTYRRGVYHQNARAARVDLLSDFDTPDSAFSAPRRASTVTPLQALTQMNHGFTMDMASKLAERLEHEAGSEPADQVQRAFLLAYARSPVTPERDAAIRLIERAGLVAFCRAVLNSNELIYLD